LTFKPPFIPTPPLTTNAPVVFDEDDVVDKIFAFLPTLTFPEVPAPPATTNAPVDVDEKAVVDEVLILPFVVISPVLLLFTKLHEGGAPGVK